MPIEIDEKRKRNKTARHKTKWKTRHHVHQWIDSFFFSSFHFFPRSRWHHQHHLLMNRRKPNRGSSLKIKTVSFPQTLKLLGNLCLLVIVIFESISIHRFVKCLMHRHSMYKFHTLIIVTQVSQLASQIQPNAQYFNLE